MLFRIAGHRELKAQITQVGTWGQMKTDQYMCVCFAHSKWKSTVKNSLLKERYAQQIRNLALFEPITYIFHFITTIQVAAMLKWVTEIMITHSTC